MVPKLDVCRFPFLRPQNVAKYESAAVSSPQLSRYAATETKYFCSKQREEQNGRSSLFFSFPYRYRRPMPSTPRSGMTTPTVTRGPPPPPPQSSPEALLRSSSSFGAAPRNQRCDLFADMRHPSLPALVIFGPQASWHLQEKKIYLFDTFRIIPGVEFISN